MARRREGEGALALMPESIPLGWRGRLDERKINLNPRPTVSRHPDRADHYPLVAASH